MIQALLQAAGPYLVVAIAGCLFGLYPLAITGDAILGQPRNDDGRFDENRTKKLRRLYLLIGIAVLLMTGYRLGALLGYW